MLKIRKLVDVKLAGICLFFILFSVIFTTNSAEAKVDENKCRFYYEKYKELKESKFIEKYKNKSFVYDCLKLYKDPNWYFVGKNKIDRNYEKLDILLNGNNKIDVKILSTITLGQDKYLLKFRTCSEKQTVAQPAYLIKSKIYQFIATSNKILQAGKCYDYSVQVKAKSSSNIQIEYLSDLSKYAGIKSRTI